MTITALKQPVCFSGKQSYSHKPVVGVTDCDGTIINWDTLHEKPNMKALTETADSFKTPLVRENTDHVVLTGRTLQTTQRIAPFFNRFPNLQFLLLDDGKLAFKKKDPSQPTGEWIQSLTPQDQDKGYAREVKKLSGWEGRKVTTVIEEALSTSGFTKQPSKQTNPNIPRETVYVKETPVDRVFIERYSDEPLFEAAYSTGLAKQAFQHSIEALANNILTTLQDDEGMALELESYNRHFITDSPEGKPVQYRAYRYAPLTQKGSHFSKADGVQIILNREYPNASGVITAGDNQNDIPMLKKKHYRNGSNEKILNYPVQSGDFKELSTSIAEHPRLRQVEQGHIGPAIEQHLEAILESAEKTAKSRD